MPSRALDVILAALALLGPFAVHLFFPVIPVIKIDFGLSDALAQLTFTVGVFGMAFSTLAYGTYADRYGRRPVLLVGLSLFVIGSVISTFANSFVFMLIGRIVQSIGAGCGMTLARAIARDVYGSHGLVKSIAYLTMFAALGALLAPGFGGFMIDQVGWRSVFVFASITGIAVTICAYVVVTETGKPAEPAARAPMLAGFFELLRQPRFCALVVHSGCSTGTFMIVATASAVLMKEALHRPATEFGLYFAMMPIGFVIGSVVSSRVGNRASVERMIMIGALLALVAVAVQSSALLLGYLSPLVLFLPGAFITMAQGISLPFAQSGAMAMIPRLAGTAAGIGFFAQHFLGGIFALIYGLFADGSPLPMTKITAVTVALGLITAAIPSLLARPKP